MNTTVERTETAVSIPTVIAIGLIVMGFVVALHELTHAITCPLVGGDLQVYTALGVDCSSDAGTAGRMVAGSAPFIDLIIGFILYLYLRRRPALGDTAWYMIWLFMLAKWLSGIGYLLFSGLAGVGDMAVVIDGWEPAWLWRGGMLLIGVLGFLGLIALALQVFGTRVGGTPDELYGRAQRMTIWSYAGFIIPVVLAAFFNPDGLGGLPAVAGLAAVVFAQSPLLWMMQWFQAKMFTKLPGPPLGIRPSTPIIVAALIVVVVYGVILGRGVTF